MAAGTPVGGSAAIGAAVGGGTAGSVLFIGATGNLAQDNAKFTYTTAAGLGAPVTIIKGTTAQTLAVGANGNTNPAFSVDCSAVSVATGLAVQGAAAGNGVVLQVTSSATDEGLTIQPKGAGTIHIGGPGTGTVNVGGGAAGFAVGCATVINNTLAVSKTISGGSITPVYANPLSLDVTLGLVYNVTTTAGVGDCTINATTGGTAGQLLSVIVTNDATASRKITWGTNFATTPAFVGVPNYAQTFEFKSNGTSWAPVLTPTLEVDVTRYGIVGDGTTDNTAAMNALITATPNGTCYRWPKGTCSFAGELLFGAKTAVYMRGVGSCSNSAFNASTLLSTATALNGTITGAVNDGTGLIKLTYTGTDPTNGQQVVIAGVWGTTEANGTWTIGNLNAGAKTFTLTASTFTHTYASGGTWTIVTSLLNFNFGNTAGTVILDGLSITGPVRGRGIFIVGGGSSRFTNLNITVPANGVGIWAGGQWLNNVTANSWFDSGMDTIRFTGPGTGGVSSSFANSIGLIVEGGGGGYLNNLSFGGLAEGARISGNGLFCSGWRTEVCQIGLNLAVDSQGNAINLDRSTFASMSYEANDISIKTGNTSNSVFSAINVLGTVGAPSGESKLGMLYAGNSCSFHTVQFTGRYADAGVRLTGVSGHFDRGCGVSNAFTASKPWGTQTGKKWDVQVGLTGYVFDGPNAPLRPDDAVANPLNRKEGRFQYIGRVDNTRGAVEGKNLSGSITLGNGVSSVAVVFTQSETSTNAGLSTASHGAITGGGTLVAGTYFYKGAIVSIHGESPSDDASILAVTVTGAGNNSNRIAFAASAHADGWYRRLYRATAIPITGATNTNPIQFTSVGHQLYTGQQVSIAMVLGNTAANNASGKATTGTVLGGTNVPHAPWTATVIDADHFSINTAGNGTYAQGTITGAVTSGGLIKLTVTAHGRTTGDVILVASVGGTTEANGTWQITVVDANTFTLDGSVFVNAYTSGGTYTTGFWHAVWDGYFEGDFNTDATFVDSGQALTGIKSPPINSGTDEVAMVEPDANYYVIPSVLNTGAGAAWTPGIEIKSQTTAGFTAVFSAATPDALRVFQYFILR